MKNDDNYKRNRLAVQLLCAAASNSSFCTAATATSGLVKFAVDTADEFYNAIETVQDVPGTVEIDEFSDDALVIDADKGV